MNRLLPKYGQRYITRYRQCPFFYGEFLEIDDAKGCSYSCRGSHCYSQIIAAHPTHHSALCQLTPRLSWCIHSVPSGLNALIIATIKLFSTPPVAAMVMPLALPAYKRGMRAMPSQVPIIPDQSLAAQKAAWAFF